MPTTGVACLVENIIDEHTYDVENTLNPTTEQKIEVTHREADALIRNFKGNVPLLWNHGLDPIGKEPIGRLLNVYKKDNGLFCVYEQNDGVINDVVKSGVINNISMNHSRLGGIDNYTIEEASFCHTGLRKGTGVIDLENKPSTIDTSINQESIACSSETKMDVDATEVESTTSQTETLDVEGYKRFQDAVQKWQDEGVKPDDWEESDGSILEYQMKRYTNNNFLDSQSSEFMIKQLGNMVIKEKEREHSNVNDRTQFVSLLNSIAKNHLSSNGVKVTPQQIEEARKRLIEESPESVHLPVEQLNQLCEVRASFDAAEEEKRSAAQSVPTQAATLMQGFPTAYRSANVQQAYTHGAQQGAPSTVPPVVHAAIPIAQNSAARMDVDEDKAIRLKQLELEIENKKIEALLIQDKLNKHVANSEAAKHNQKMETLLGMQQKIQQKSKYKLPEAEEIQPIHKRHQSSVEPSYDLSRFKLNPVEVSRWERGMDPWGKPKEATKIRTIREIAMQTGIGNPLENTSHNDQFLKPGNRNVICSKEYEEKMRKTGGDHPLNRSMDLAVLMLGNDNIKLETAAEFVNVRRIQKQYNESLLSHFPHWQSGSRY